MKEQELDKYVEKIVRLTDTDNDTHEGKFYKIIDGKFKVNGLEQIACINKGYVLDKNYCWYNLRKSHIKKIEEI